MTKIFNRLAWAWTVCALGLHAQTESSGFEMPVTVSGAAFSSQRHQVRLEALRVRLFAAREAAQPLTLDFRRVQAWSFRQRMGRHGWASVDGPIRC